MVRHRVINTENCFPTTTAGTLRRVDVTLTLMRRDGVDVTSNDDASFRHHVPAGTAGTQIRRLTPACANLAQLRCRAKRGRGGVL